MIKVEIENRESFEDKKTVAKKTTVYVFGIKVYTKTIKPNSDLLRDK